MIENRKVKDQVEIIDYDPQFAEDFRDINYEWLEEYFEIEPYDKIVLNNPERDILGQGGCIFFAKLDDKVVGTFALLKHTDSKYELAKFGVLKDYRKYGIGKMLMEKAIDKAIELKCASLILVTSDKLITANKLYEKYGFVRKDMSIAGPIPYVRCSHAMELILTTDE